MAHESIDKTSRQDSAHFPWRTGKGYIRKNESLLAGTKKKKKNILWRVIEGKVHKSLKSEKVVVGGPKIKRYSTKTCSTHSLTMERAAIRIVRSTVSPALFYDGRHTLLVLPLVLLVQLSCLTVGWTVGVWFIKQRLDRCQNRGDIVSGTPTIL